MLIVIMLAVLVFLTFINVPIAVALASAAVAGMLYQQGPDSLVSVAIEMYRGSTSFSLIAIPMFVLAGAIMNAGGITRRLIAFVAALIGFMRGGLAMVTIGVSMLFAEISGSAVADVAAIGSILIPSMKKQGYPAPFAAAVNSSAASLAIIIPPSIPMILYAIAAGTSVEQLFVAGFVPGIIGGVGLMAVARWLTKRYNLPVAEGFDWKRVRETFVDALPTFLLPIIILGGIFSGLVTATEAAGLAVLAAIIVGLWYREFDLQHLRVSMLDGGMQTAVVMLLVAASILMGDLLTVSRLPQQLADGILNLTDNKWLILLILNVLFLVIGFFLHSSAAIILVIPIVMPLIQRVGIDPIHFGLVVTLNLAIGQQTPPVASVLITACTIAKADIWETTKVNIYFIGVLVGVLLLCTYVPAVPLFLVQAFYAKP